MAGAGEVVDPKSVGTDEYKSRKRSTENQIYYLYIFVALIVSSSWILGAFSFSFLWVFLLLAILFTVWQTQVTQLVRHHLQLEEVTVYRKRALRHSETTEWLNFIINRWWVFSSSTIEDLVKKRLDPRLAEVKPPFISQIELFNFDIGEQTPFFKNVKVFEFDDGVPGGQKPITWLTVMQAPFGLHKMSSFKVVVEADLSLHSNDFQMIFRSLIGANKASVNVDFAVENLSITGRVQMIANLSMDVPFPHISKATVFFTETPEVWFNVRALKALQLMQIPLLKSWIYTHVMEGLTEALVDPGKIDLNMAKAGPVFSPRQKMAPKPLAQGVLTITIKGKPAKEAGENDVLYHVLKVQENKRNTHEVQASEEWEDVCSFFVHDLAKDKKYWEAKDGSVLTLVMQYDTLTPIDVDNHMPVTENRGKGEPLITDQPSTEVSGVMYVCIHGGTNVMASDKGDTSDPYCVLFCDRRRILTTPYIAQTRNPKWDSTVEFFVGNFTKTTLSFFLYDWDGTNVIDDDFLGSAHLTLSRDQPLELKKVLTLGYNKPTEGHVENKSFGCITVSAVFRPVSSVGKSEKYKAFYEGWTSEYLYHQADVKSGTLPPAAHQGQPGPAPHQPTMRQRWTPVENENNNDAHSEEQKRRSAKEMATEVLEDKLFIELTIIQAKELVAADRNGECKHNIDKHIQAKELVAADRNGYSDPFVEVRLGKKKVYETSVKKKTLSPLWEEHVTFILPKVEEQLEISVLDKDMIGKDFLGNVLLTIDQLKALSVKESPQWYKLERTKSGQIELRCNITSADEKNLNFNTNNKKNKIAKKQLPPVPAVAPHQSSIKQLAAQTVPTLMPNIRNGNHSNLNSSAEPAPVLITPEPMSLVLPLSTVSPPDHMSLESPLSPVPRTSPLSPMSPMPQTSPTDSSVYDSSFMSVEDSSIEIPASPTLVAPPVIRLPEPVIVPQTKSEIPQKRTVTVPNGGRPGHEKQNNQQKPVQKIQAQTPPPKRLLPGRSGIRMKRSVSDVNVSQSNKAGPGGSPSTQRLRPAESLRSFAGWDTMSTASSVLVSEKFFNVRGRLLWVDGLGEVTSDIYCKIRIDNRRSHHRSKKLSPGKVVAKTGMLKPDAGKLDINFDFKVDEGRGVAAEGLIIFDLKQGPSSHLATKGFTLKYLLADTELDVDLSRHLPLDNGIEIDLIMSHSALDPALLKKRRGIFRSFSFGRLNKENKDKDNKDKKE